MTQNQGVVHTTPYPCDCANDCRSSVEIPLDKVAEISEKDLYVIILGHTPPKGLTLIEIKPPEITSVLILPGQRFPTDSELAATNQGYGIYRKKGQKKRRKR